MTSLTYEHRFSIQRWVRRVAVWRYDSEIAEADTAEAVGVALLTLTADGEFEDAGVRVKAAVWDRRDDRYVGGNPW